LGQRVQVQWNDLHVRLLSPTTGQLLREHLRTRRGWYRIHDDDRPARTPPTTLALLARTTSAGPHIGAVCTQIHQHDGVPGVRRILGVLALAKQYGAAAADDAAKAALDLGVPTYRFLRRYLERRLPAPLTLRQVDPLIRQLTLYRDLIDRKTGDPL
ncbi:MAG: IS21-like element ISGau7 family transposase, partial [Burkholderiales bacterium]